MRTNAELITSGNFFKGYAHLRIQLASGWFWRPPEKLRYHSKITAFVLNIFKIPTVKVESNIDNKVVYIRKSDLDKSKFFLTYLNLELLKDSPDKTRLLHYFSVCRKEPLHRLRALFLHHQTNNTALPVEELGNKDVEKWIEERIALANFAMPVYDARLR